MQPGEALDAAAQIAVTLLGFAGIVVVFRPDSVHRWSPLDKLRLRLLLLNSLFPLVYSIFGILLLTIDPPPVWIWRWCSGFVILFGLVAMAAMRRHVSRGDIRGTSKAVFYTAASLSIVSFVLQFANVISWNRLWPFFTAIALHLVIAVVQFLRIILLPAEKQ